MSLFYRMSKNIVKKIINRGTGAGGKNTNIKGKAFEKITNYETQLLNNGYERKIINKTSKNAYYLHKTIEIDGNKYDIDFVQQSGLNFYMKKFYKLEMVRNPDEAYIITPKSNNQKVIIKILEKKTQNVEGSVETKLWSSPSLKREYEILLGNNFIVEYGLCINSFLKQKVCKDNKTKNKTKNYANKCKKYEILNKILEEANIDILYGDDNDYLENLTKWINKMHI